MKKKRRRPIRRRKRTRRSKADRFAAQLERGEKALVDGRPHDVIDACEAALATGFVRGRERARVLALQANALIMLNRFEEAHNALTLAIYHDPDDAYLFYNRSLTAFYTGRSAEAVLNLRRAIELEGDGREAANFAAQMADLQEIIEGELGIRGPAFTFEQLLEQQSLYHKALLLFMNEDWQGAEDGLRQVIAMSDGLAPPWGNLGLCLLIQQRYDEAEVALKRALEIDPDYEPARSNIERLPEIRETGELPPLTISSSSRNVAIKTDIKFEGYSGGLYGNADSR